eukprot:3038265-Rhodomonas_salina.2
MRKSLTCFFLVVSCPASVPDSAQQIQKPVPDSRYISQYQRADSRHLVVSYPAIEPDSAHQTRKERIADTKQRITGTNECYLQRLK